MHLINAFVGFMQEGGFFMYPILLVLTLGLSISLERFLYLTNVKKSNLRVWGQMLPLIEKGRFSEAMGAATASDAAVGKILAYGLSRLNATRRRVDLETAMEEGLMEIIPRLEKRTHYLATFANISTLLGLLGTVTGLIEAFAAVANADPAQKAELLSASISVAMNCTAFGLGAAIPMMLIYSFLQSKTTELVDSLEMVTVKFLNLLQDQAPAQAPAAASLSERIA
jgi:biopolymer transport protein ExbB/TolQ